MRRSGWLTWLFVGIGIVLRVDRYRFNRSVWLDEAWLALNIAHKPIGILLSAPLDNNQAAPIGFLALEKLAIALLGDYDFVLRLLPLVSGIVALPLMVAVARRYLPRRAIPIAVGLLAVNTYAIYYASELKPYASDLALTLVILWRAPDLFRASTTRRTLLTLALIGAVAVWLAYPAIFVLAGVGLALILNNLWRRDGATLRRVLPVLSVWIGSFGLSYAITVQSAAASTYLYTYWRGFDAFARLSGAWFSVHMRLLLLNPGGLPDSVAVTVLAVLGMGGLVRTRGRLGLGGAAIFGVVLIVSAIGKYPFADRLLLFSVPLVYMVIALGIAQISTRAGNLRGLVRLGLAASLLIPMMLTTLESSYAREEIKPILAAVAARRTADDRFYVYYDARPAFEYYRAHFGLDDLKVVAGVQARAAPDRYGRDVAQMCGGRRVWFIFAHSWGAEETLITDWLDRHGARLDTIQAIGASAYVYDLGVCGP